MRLQTAAKPDESKANTGGCCGSHGQSPSAFGRGLRDA